MDSPLVLPIFQRFIIEGALKKLLQLWAVQAVIIMGLFGMHIYLGAVLLGVLPWARLSRWSNRGTCHRIIYNHVNTLLEFTTWDNGFSKEVLRRQVAESCKIILNNLNDYRQLFIFNLLPFMCSQEIDLWRKE